MENEVLLENNAGIQENQDGNDDQEMAIAELVQQNYFENFGDRDWDLYEDDEHLVLKRFIGFALFGPPSQLATVENETGYKADQNEDIDNIYKLLLKNNFGRNKKRLYIRLIYICWNFTYEDKLAVGRAPVFVLKKCHEDDEYSSKLNCKIFIDSCGRVYESWESYLENNQLPKCTMVCPQDGQYKGTVFGDEAQVLLEYHESPACSIGRQVLNATDLVGTGVSVLTTVGGLATLVVAAPALGVATAVGGVATGAYMIGRNIYTLTDRGLHQQSIGLDNSESRWSWFGIGTGVVASASTAATGVVRTLASQGKNISKGAQLSLNVLNGANMVTSTTGILFSGYNLIDKFRNDETITPLEIFQFSASLLFFYRSVVDFQTAETLISKTQEATLKNYEKTLRSNKHRKVFRKAVKETERLNGITQGRTEVISGINNIADKDAFFAGLARVNKDMNKTGARFEITADGNVRINSAHIVDPNEFANMNRGARVNVLNDLPPKQITISQPDFNTSKSNVNDAIDSLRKGLPISEVFSCIGMIAQNGENFAFLTVNLAKTTVRKLFNILNQFLDEIQDRFNDFAQTFPMADTAVGVMQYIINYIKTMARDFELEIDQFINCLFNADGSINTEFLKHLKRDFNLWLNERLLLRTNRSTNSNNDVQRERKICKKCSGRYYQN